jgi:predicted transcriptional regulator
MADDVSCLNSWEEGGRENRRMRVMVEVWRHGVITVRYLAIAMDALYRDTREHKTDRVVRVRDSLQRYVQGLASEGLVKPWLRQRQESLLTLTEKGERLLEEYGYGYQSYAKGFAKSQHMYAEHHLMVTRCSLKCLDSAKFMVDEGDVLPSVEIPSGEKNVRMDKIWRLGRDQSFVVEVERRKKPDIELEKKMQAYVSASKDGTFKRLGLLGVRVLWITEGKGQIPRLQEIAEKTEQAMQGHLFYFTHEGTYVSWDQQQASFTPHVNLIDDKIWQLCDGVGVSL